MRALLVPRVDARPSDAPLVGLAIVHGLLLASRPSFVVVGLAMWWTSNTIAHCFIHRPFFRQPLANAMFAAYLSAVVGVPQRLWRERHLAHHAGRAWRWRWSWALVVESFVVATCWSLIALLAPAFFVGAYVPGMATGLLLCAAHGFYEHHGGTVSHYGWLYNTLCFNDGFHVEHHAHPGVHWSRLPARREPDAEVSRMPAPLRWIEDLSLDGLERLALHSPRLQRALVASHRRAIAGLCAAIDPPSRVLIVGGGLFPRTALVVRDLFPEATVVIADASPANLAVARSRLTGRFAFECRRVGAGDRAARDFDLVIVPLAFAGDREAIYDRPLGKATIVHDWIWRGRGEGRVVSRALLKRVNLVRA